MLQMFLANLLFVYTILFALFVLVILEFNIHFSLLFYKQKILSLIFILFNQNPWEVMVTKGTLKTQRFITAVDMKQPEFTEQLSRELWRRIYVEVKFIYKLMILSYIIFF